MWVTTYQLHAQVTGQLRLIVLTGAWDSEAGSMRFEVHSCKPAGNSYQARHLISSFMPLASKRALSSGLMSMFPPQADLRRLVSSRSQRHTR